jgi:hypothetical protein
MEAQAVKDATQADGRDTSRKLTPLGAINTREAALRSGWVAEAAAQRRGGTTTFNSAV